MVNMFVRLNHYLLWIPVLCTIAILFIDSANVLTIRLFGVRATPSQKELIEEIVTIVALFPVAYIYLVPGFIKTELIVSRIRPGVRFVLEVASDLVILIVAGFCSYAGIGGFIKAVTTNALKMGSWQFPLWPFFGFIALGFVFLAIAAIFRIIQRIQNPHEDYSVDEMEKVIKGAEQATES